MDFEKDNVFLTERAQDCHKVQYQRSIGLVCPLPLPAQWCVFLVKENQFRLYQNIQQLFVPESRFRLPPAEKHGSEQKRQLTSRHHFSITGNLMEKTVGG
ncbi:MAG TPA: hypothetical protein VIN60_11265, partial [Anaerolineales bacterium]